MNLFEGVLRSEGDTLIFDGDTIQCPLPADKFEILTDWVGKKVCLGIRPRALKLSGENDTTVFEGKIEVSEMLGEEVLAHVESGDHKYITSINPHEAAALKDGVIRLTPDLELAHIFDAETGRNLTLPEDVRKQTLTAAASAQ